MGASIEHFVGFRSAVLVAYYLSAVRQLDMSGGRCYAGVTLKSLCGQSDMKWKPRKELSFVMRAWTAM